MDSLSLREACLLRQRLPAHGYEVLALDYAFKGRYTGDFGGVYLHRGLSLMECLTPWLVVQGVG